MSDHDYAAGLRDGEIMGAVLLIQFAPSIQNILGM